MALEEFYKFKTQYDPEFTESRHEFLPYSDMPEFDQNLPDPINRLYELRLNTKDDIYPLSSKSKAVALEGVQWIIEEYIQGDFPVWNDYLELICYDKEIDADGNPIKEVFSDLSINVPNGEDPFCPYTPTINQHYVEVMAHPEKNLDKYEGLFTALNQCVDECKTKHNEFFEDLLNKLIEYLYYYSGEEYEKGTGKPPLIQSKMKNLFECILEFYDEYDPNDFKHEKAGYGQETLDYLDENGKPDYRRMDPCPILIDLHSLINGKDKSDELVDKVQGFIQTMRVYFEDIVEDVAYTFELIPGRDSISGEFSSTRFGSEHNDLNYDPDTYDCVYRVKDEKLLQLTEYEKKGKIETAQFAVYNPHADRTDNNRCRTVTGLDEKSRIIYGTIYVVNMDKKGNIFDCHGLYGMAEKRECFYKNPLSDERVQELLLALVGVVIQSDKSKEYLPLINACFTEREIKDYMNCLGIIYDPYLWPKSGE